MQYQGDVSYTTHLTFGIYVDKKAGRGVSCKVLSIGTTPGAAWRWNPSGKVVKRDGPCLQKMTLRFSLDRVNKMQFLTRIRFDGIQRARKALNTISGEQFAIRHFGNEMGAGTEMCLAIVSGIVAGDSLVSYWPIFFPVPSNSPRCLCDPVSLSFLDHYTFSNLPSPKPTYCP